MERRYQVFVSSTYEDLKEERLEVMKALLELGCIPAGMEYFPAGDDEAWKYVTDLIDECDYYIVVVAGRYGSVDSDGVSFTEREYRYAVQVGVPVAAFLHAAPSAIPSGDTESDPMARERLDDFRRLCRQRLCKEWTTAHELGAVVSRSLTQLIRRHPRPGWVRSVGLASEDAARKILELRDIIEAQQARLDSVEPPKGSEHLAQGTDPVDLNVRVTLERDGSTWRDHDRLLRTSHSLTVTWDELFGFLAPHTTEWVPAAKVRAALARGLKERVAPVVRKEYPEYSTKSATPSSTTFDTIMVQFLALGLVESSSEMVEAKSGQKASVVWKLTPYGRRHLFSVMAQQRE